MVQPHGTHYTSDAHFTYILDYMGESIAVQTVRPTRFKLLNLCFIASSALQNDESPPNHLFRPTCAPSWLGHVVKLFSDDVLQVMIHESIKRGDNALHISVNFTPIGARRSGPPRELNGLPVEVPVIVDMGGRHRHPIVQHVTHVPAPPPTVVAVAARPAVPLIPSTQPLNGVTEHAPQNRMPVCFHVAAATVSSPVNTLQGQRATEVRVNPRLEGVTHAPPQSEYNEVHLHSPAQQVIESVHTPLPVQPDVGDSAISGKPPSAPKRMYKCQKCEGIGHSKRFCKLKKPAHVRPESSTSAEVRYLGMMFIFYLMTKVTTFVCMVMHIIIIVYLF